MDIKALAQKYEPYIIERRRYFHAHPELSFKEWETTKALVAEFEKMGYGDPDLPRLSRLIATLDTGKPGPHRHAACGYRCSACKGRHRP